MPKRRTGGWRLSFWMASAAVFLVNAVLSVTNSSWMLASLQAMTAVLATLAAIEDWEARRRAARSGQPVSP